MISSYHQKYTKQSNSEIEKKADVKERELLKIFKEVSIHTNSDQIRVAVLGCGDKRFIAHHKRIFEKILKRNVTVITFDITIDHLAGELNIIQHDCTVPLLNPPYDITYGHVLLKFIETKKHFDLLKNSYEALKPGGLAIHCFDWEDLKATNPKLPDGSWTVPLEELKLKLTELGITYKEIKLTYGPALVLLRS